ncbi:MAG: DUF1570 domain-containing protein [Planctomycetota bacterium]|jgi:hypothetical protein
MEGRKSIPYISTAAILSLIIFFLAGCGGSGGDKIFPAPQGGPPPGTVQYGNEWVTLEEMEALRETERTALGWDFEYKIATDHYMIYSSATLEQTNIICTAAEALYKAYAEFFGPHFTLLADHPYLQVKLFRDRDEFREIALSGGGWAEGYYDGLYCNLYYDTSGPNPYHWFLHEATHQMNWEVAEFYGLPQWIDEGIACYFGTSLPNGENLVPGNYDVNAYPVWWLPDMQGGQVIDLEYIVSGQGGPDMDTYFNLYYAQWWSLTHFLFHYGNGKYKSGYIEVIRAGGSLSDFEQHIGNVDTIHSEWYTYFNSL